MTLRVSGKNLDIGEALRTRIEARIAEAIEKFFDRGWSGRAIVEREGTFFRTDCILHLSSGVELQSHATAADAYQSCDLACERIEKRLRRYKRKLREDHGGERAVPTAPMYVLQAPPEDDDVDVDTGPDGDHPVVVAETTTGFGQISVAEAVSELDLTGAPVVIFRHATSGRINVVYRRADGNIGWIDPPAESH
ncbi:ribosome hibernation-promoting factor, HPF/YfiA family [Blastochloris viridis]|uniref:Ribosome hibernation promoting factor n=1 Tax=Blastochloris viridis TaxID=1079 RepID=A0A0H5BNX9_BLAVI|nr:ribosome-associated translation inhibitor RaiA [Blastochloris viridis]ALK08313.1 Ribosome-associated factor Y [Blastochloris viridis]BAR98418.1 ribosomal subunit interface protein [Blastochloris viridis]CUU44235.1 Ribosome-associated factor Y [Blastochloris viridis]